MTASDQPASVTSWTEPEGLNPRGTVIVIPGRGERPGVYERFGRRIAADAYRVHAVANPVDDPALAEEQVHGLLDGPKPVVLAGSDTGALFAAGLVASGRLPRGRRAHARRTADPCLRQAAGQAPAPRPGGGARPQDRLPTHRERLAGPVLRRGALYEPVPDGWLDQADLKAVAVPVLSLHGSADPVSPVDAASERYAAAPRAEQVVIADGRHDALNDVTHRTTPP